MYHKIICDGILGSSYDYIVIGGYSTYTTSYKSRVEADGGIIDDIDAIETAYDLITEQGLSPAAWWAADFGYKDAGSGKVSKLYDLSSNDNDATQATDASRPVWTDLKLNSRPGLVCDGGDKLSFTAAEALTVVAVVDKDAVTNKGVFLSYTSDSNNYIACANESTGSRYDYCLIEAASNSLAPAGDVNTPRILTMLYTARGGTLSLARNGSFGASAQQQSTSNIAYFNTLVAYSSATYSLDGDLYEICLFGTALEESKRQAIESYLATKWGIT